MVDDLRMASQIQAVLDAGILPPLVHLLATAEFDIKKEAAWALSNATSGGTADQIKFLVQCGCIKPLCDLLTCSDVRIVTVALEGLENILKIGEAQKELTGPQAVNVYAQANSDIRPSPRCCLLLSAPTTWLLRSPTLQGMGDSCAGHELMPTDCVPP